MRGIFNCRAQPSPLFILQKLVVFHIFPAWPVQHKLLHPLPPSDYLSGHLGQKIPQYADVPSISVKMDSIQRVIFTINVVDFWRHFVKTSAKSQFTVHVPYLLYKIYRLQTGNVRLFAARIDKFCGFKLTLIRTFVGITCIKRMTQNHTCFTNNASVRMRNPTRWVLKLST